jgi:WD40 repeat protein
VDWSPDGRLLASGASKDVALWRVADGRLEHLRDLKGHVGLVESVAFAPDGTLLASVAKGDFLEKTDDYTLRLWRVSACAPAALSEERPPGCGELLHTLALEPKSGDVESVVFSPDGALLAVALANKVLLWRVADGTLLRTLEGHASTVYGVAFAPDGTTLASGAWDNTVRLWQISGCASASGECGRLLYTLDGHTDYVTSVAFAPDGVWLASGSYDGTVRLWGVWDR